MYSIGNYINIINHNGKILQKTVYMCITESLGCKADWYNIVNQLYFNKNEKQIIRTYCIA